MGMDALAVQEAQVKTIYDSEERRPVHCTMKYSAGNVRCQKRCAAAEATMCPSPSLGCARR